jgi:cytochrome P450
MAWSSEDTTFNSATYSYANEPAAEASSKPTSGKSIPIPFGKQSTNPYQHCRKQILAVKADMDAGRKLKSRPTIFQALLTPDPDQGYVVPTVDQIKDEAYSTLGAAADTTGNAMTVATYHIVSNQLIYKRLKAELKAAFPDPEARLSFVELEKLPYLVSVSNLAP